MSDNKKARPHLKPYHWVPGECPNPKGRPRLDPLVKAFREKTDKEFVEALIKYGEYSVDEMEAYLESNIGVMEKFFAKFIFDAANGDAAARALVTERLYGAVPKKIDFNLVVRNLSNEELIARHEALLQKAKSDMMIEATATEVKHDLGNADHSGDSSGAENPSASKRDHSAD